MATDELATIHKVIGERLQQVETKFSSQRTQGARPPDVLYHYTTAAGLLGIVESNRLWASDVLYMNDSTEVDYGRKLIVKLSSEAAANAKSPTAKRLFGDIEAVLFPMELVGGAFYAACFCERSDLLSQWRGYSGGTGGYSLGFWADYLKGRSEEPIPERRFLLRSVLYNLEEQRRLMGQFLADVDTVLVELLNGDLAQHEGVIQSLASAMIQRQTLECMLTMKNRVFEQEQEWRLIHHRPGLPGSPRANLMFRPTRSFLVPYVELDVTRFSLEAVAKLPERLRRRLSESNPVPLVNVVVGPTVHPRAAAASVRALLRDRIPEAKVTDSKVPLRA